MHRFIKLFRWINVFVILATFLSYLSPYVSPETNWQISLFSLLYPWLLLLNILFLLFWAAMKQKYFFLSLGCILMGWGHLTSTIGWKGGTVAPNKEVINIMSFNVQTLSYIFSPKKEKERFRRFYQFRDWLDSEKIDVFCAQEMQRLHDNHLDSIGLVHHHRFRGKSASIHSRFPIVNKGRIEFYKSANIVLWADIEFAKGQIVRVYSLHLQSSGINPESIDVLAKGKIQEKKTWFNLKYALRKFKNASIRRAYQAEQVAVQIRKSPHPVIVCGDFNETPNSYAYKTISESLQDAFKTKGSGFGTTYAGKIPGLQIDYILTDQRIDILKHEILDKPFSDHYPIKSTIKLPSK